MNIFTPELKAISKQFKIKVIGLLIVELGFCTLTWLDLQIAYALQVTFDHFMICGFNNTRTVQYYIEYFWCYCVVINVVFLCRCRKKRQGNKHKERFLHENEMYSDESRPHSQSQISQLEGTSCTVQVNNLQTLVND